MIEDGVKISELTEASSITGTDIVPIVNDTETKSATINQIATYTNNQLPSYEGCIATMTGQATAGSEYYVPLDLISKRYGPTGNFTLQDGGVKIGSNINHIRISGNIFIENYTGGSSYLWARIYRFRNGTASGIATSINGSNSSFVSSPVPPTLIDVQENDIIKLMADIPGGGTIRGYADNTWLCIEKID